MSKKRGTENQQIEIVVIVRRISEFSRREVFVALSENLKNQGVKRALVKSIVIGTMVSKNVVVTDAS
jgi:recombinational DNA repair protein RecR